MSFDLSNEGLRSAGCRGEPYPAGPRAGSGMMEVPSLAMRGTERIVDQCALPGTSDVCGGGSGGGGCSGGDGDGGGGGGGGGSGASGSGAGGAKSHRLGCVCHLPRCREMRAADAVLVGRAMSHLSTRPPGTAEQAALADAGALSEYEWARMETIRRNQDKLRELMPHTRNDAAGAYTRPHFSTT